MYSQNSFRFVQPFYIFIDLAKFQKVKGGARSSCYTSKTTNDTSCQRQFLIGYELSTIFTQSNAI